MGGGPESWQAGGVPGRENAHRAVLIPGDGVGPDITAAATRVVAAAGVDVDWDLHEVGASSVERGRDPLPASTVEAIRALGVGLKGPVSTSATGGFRSVNIGLRRALGLSTQVRWCRSFPGVPTPFAGVDLLVVRETTEDLYGGVDLPAGEPGTRQVLGWLQERGAALNLDAALSVKLVSAAATRRAARAACEYAVVAGRRRVTIVHKATVMRATDGLFLQTARDEAAGFPGLEVDDALVDSVAADLVRRPSAMDVLFTLNLYGDILADLAGGVVGSIGLVAGVNIGDGVAVFEPAHGTAPRHAGQDRVNPAATILSAALLLRHLDEVDAADRVDAAVASVLKEGKRVTYDVVPPGGSPVGTAAMTDAIVDRLR
jgi:isocitrate dehydrogenase (NAD+)